MTVKLKKHNEIAYQKLIEDLKKNKITTINHATGTGKSFITLKYLYENRDKRILYLCPTYPIYNQLVNKHMKSLGISISDFKKMDNIIYSNLAKLDMEKLASEYDIVICDEYQRLGAEIWGKHGRKLRDELLKYPGKVMIGLTATDIRYLDNERNMTNELFEGNCASNISLGEAIITGLLPAPTYINTLSSIESNIDLLKSKVDELVYYEKDKKKYYDLIEKTRRYIESYLGNKNDFKPYIKNDNGKYILFNSTIESIKKNKKKLKEMFGTDNINFYEVHSRKSVEQNQEAIDQFSNSKNGINVICVVDILNEGVHIDDVDGVVMMRKTTSPIIYFQQLGRLLSFSTRDKDLVVWDLVGNLYNHRVIYNLYEDVTKMAQKLIKEDPANEKRYSDILEKFKIVDNTAKIRSEIENLNSKLNVDSLIENRLSTAVSILENKINCSVEEKIQAHIDLFKYSSYVTSELQSRIRLLNITIPDIFNVSEDEFIKNLNGFKNLKEQKLQNNDIFINEIKKYYEDNKRFPSVYNGNESEVKMAYDIASKCLNLSSQYYAIYAKTLKQDTSLTTYDKVYYGISISPKKYAEFEQQLKNVYKNKNMINENVINFLKDHRNNQNYIFERLLYMIGYEKTKKKNAVNVGKLIMEFARKNNGRLPKYDSTSEEEKKLYLMFYSESNSYIEKYTRIIQSGMYRIYDEEAEDEVKQEVDQVANEILKFIQIKGRLPNNDVLEWGVRTKYLSYRSYFKKYGYMEKITELLEKIVKENKRKKVDDVFSKVIEFVKDNYGDLPSSKVDDPNEVRLASDFRNCRRHFTKDQRQELNSLIIKIKAKSDNIVDLYIEFIKKNKRYPIADSQDTNERELFMRYRRCLSVLNSSDKTRIDRALNYKDKKNVMRNTFEEIKRREKNDK